MYDIHHQSIWYNAFIDCFKIDQKALFDMNSRDNTLRLFIDDKPQHRFIKTRTLYSMGFGVNDFFLLGTNTSDIESTTTDYANVLFELKSNWDKIELADIPATDPFVLPFIAKMKAQGFIVSEKPHRSFYHINLTKSWEDHYQNYIHKKTPDLRTRMNKLKRDGYTYEVCVLTTGINQYLEAILQYYEERRSLTGQPNAFSDPRQMRMLRNIIPQYEQKGWLKLSILKGSDGNDWAYQLDFVKNGIQYHYAPTFDMKYASYSPSKILLLESIRNGFADPTLKEFNFMRGESDYKKQFTLDKTSYINLEIINPYSSSNRNSRLYNKLSYIKVAFNKLFK